MQSLVKDITGQSLNAITERFGIKCEKITKLNSGSSNLNWIIEGNDGAYVLKRMPIQDEEFIKFQNWITEKLSSCDYPFVENLIIENNHAVEFDNYVWQMRPYIDGRFFELNNEIDLTMAADALIKLHMISVDDFNKKKLEVFDYWKIDYENKLLNIYNIIKNQLSSKECIEMMRIYEKVICDVISSKETSYLYRTSIVHGDFHGGNLIFDDRKLVAVIDWDTAKIQPIIYDFAKGMYLLSRKEHGNFEINSSAIKLFINTYTKHIELNNIEWNVIPLLLETNYLPKPEYMESFGNNYNKLNWYINWTFQGVKMINNQLRKYIE